MQSRVLHIAKGKLALLRPYDHLLRHSSSKVHAIQYERDCRHEQPPTCPPLRHISSTKRSTVEGWEGAIASSPLDGVDMRSFRSVEGHKFETNLVSCDDGVTSPAASELPSNVPDSIVRRTLSVRGYRAPGAVVSSMLSNYLDLEDGIERQVFARQVPIGVKSSRMPTILLAHMHLDSLKERSVADLAIEVYLRSHENFLRRRGYDMDDLARWTRILSGASADEQCERFLAQPERTPRFILLEILRHDIRHVKTLQKLLVHLLSTGTEAFVIQEEKEDFGRVAIDWVRTDDQVFHTLLTRLLRQVRNIWPAAVMSTVSLVERRLEWMRQSSLSSVQDQRLLHRVTQLTNQALTLLSIPSRLNPLINVRHIWKGQRRLLELASSFEPPLLLTQSSYRAVVSTLIGSKKTDLETKSATLRTKSWPPWRQDQDGMDARRSAEEDISRVLSALAKMQEAGHRTSASDEAALIYGGMEPDGTPTIQTRRGWRQLRRGTQNLEMSPLTWAARIEATRDVQEAWGAFLEFKVRGGIPSQAMFLAMYQKMNSHKLHLSGAKRGDFLPGDGREVSPLSNDSFTKYYIERHQPPPLQILYAEMLHTGIRPSGRCLAFLVSKARTSDEGIGYLHDSEIDQSVIERLRDPTLAVGKENFSAIPDTVLCAYVELICRLAPRMMATRDNGDTLTLRMENPKMVDRSSDRTDIVDIQEQRQRKGKHAVSRETFSHVSYLLRSSSTKYRPTWYAYFRALAREGAVIPRSVAGGKTSKWNSVTWSRMVGALKTFHSAGLELDPHGFLQLCVGFEKFATDPLIKDVPLRQLGPVHNTDREVVFSDGVSLLKHEFSKLCSCQNISEHIPILFHTMRGVHLHAYIRALGAVADHPAILQVLKWMVEHNQDLEVISEETRNGFSGFRKTLTAVRRFVESTTYAIHAQNIVEQVEWWGPWPTKDEVQVYVRHGIDEDQAVKNIDGNDLHDKVDSRPWLEGPLR